MLKDSTNRQRETMDYSRDFEIEPEELGSAAKHSGPAEIEHDAHKLEQRQKQIDYGKNTLGYATYCSSVSRSRRSKEHPRTPDKHKVCSKRAFEGLLKAWRRRLHEWDPSGAEGDCAQTVPVTPSTTLKGGASASGSQRGTQRAKRGEGLHIRGPQALHDSLTDTVCQRQNVGEKRSHPESTEETVTKAPRVQTPGGTAVLVDSLPPLRPSAPDSALAAADQEQSRDVSRETTVDGFVWTERNSSDDQEVDYEIDNAWDEDDIGL